MFDLFGPTHEQIENGNKALFANWLALVELLVEKDMIDESELCRRIPGALAKADQIWEDAKRSGSRRQPQKSRQ